MTPPLLQAGDRISLRLDSLAVGGEAVGRHEGLAVFAMWGCPGDTAEVEITEVLRTFARGVVRSVIEPSPDRVAAPCPHFGACGGCQLQHLSYDAQLRHKTAMVRDSLGRLGGQTQVEVKEAWGSEQPWLYRNRAEYHTALDERGQLTLGFARHHSHDIIPLRECGIQHPFSERVRQAVLEAMPRLGQTPAERAALLGVETLVSFHTNTGLVTLICEGRPPWVEALAADLQTELDDLRGVLFVRRRGRSMHRSPLELVWGESSITEHLAGRRYRITADAFSQNAPAQANRMVALVQEWAGVKSSDTVLDLYCGVGTFLLPLAKIARQAVGIEEDRSAVADAYANARAWRLRNVTLHERRVERMLPRLLEKKQAADIVVLDPPRKGCGPIVLAQVAQLRPRRILLVSCHPATLARDLKDLASHGYQCRQVQPIDMFPQTWHIEAVAVCEREPR